MKHIVVIGKFVNEVCPFSRGVDPTICLSEVEWLAATLEIACLHFYLWLNQNYELGDCR